MGLQCPICNGETTVVDSRSTTDGALRRRRECKKCKHRFTTFEFVEGSFPPYKSGFKQNLEINQYQHEALRTLNPKLSAIQRLEDGLMGLNGEAGEAIDILKKHLFQGHALDDKHIARELGDVAWYLAVSADALGYDLEEILQMNINKLRVRYPDGFDSAKSLNRKTGDI